VKVTNVRTAMVGVDRQNWLVVFVETDAGITGVGEASLEGLERTVDAAVHELGRYLVDQDPHRIVHHWQSMFRHNFWRGGVVLNSAMSGMEQALWDIKGKSLDVPVYSLLGGPTRERIRAYTHCHGATPQEAVDSALEIVRNGFTAFKMGVSNVHAEDDREAARLAVERVAAVREAVGPKIDIMLDNHGRAIPPDAVELMAALAPYKLLFYEEPTPPDNIHVISRLRQAGSSVPLATGERLFTKFGFRELLEEQLVDFIQPDICHAGGILELHAIAAMAEAYYVKIAPHNPNGPVATMASIHLAASIPNFLILEQAKQTDAWEDVSGQTTTVVDGYFQLPTAPGLGVILDESAFARHPYRERQYNQRFGADGSVLDI
jgi:galactonate dehydratase